MSFPRLYSSFSRVYFQALCARGVEHVPVVCVCLCVFEVKDEKIKIQIESSQTAELRNLQDRKEVSLDCRTQLAGGGGGGAQVGGFRS